MTTLNREERVLGLIANRYRRKGFSFYKRPAKDLLPEFMGGYRPDAVALGEPKNVAIEIISGSRRASSDSARAISALFEGRSDWELHMVLADEATADDYDVHVSPLATIEREVREAAALAGKGHYRAAFVLAWAALEAIAAADAAQAADGAANSRKAATKPPRELIAQLESSGRISFEQAVDLRTLLPLRHAVVHGDYSLDVQKNDAELIVSIGQAALQNS